MDRLKPCPFCGSKDIKLFVNHRDSFWFRCNKCASIDSYDTERQAVRAWNKRVAIPSAEPKWIPVSERLPKEKGIYLAYIINEYDNRFQYPMTACFSPNKVGCSPQWFPDDETASNNVVAWMPLPSPYQPQERSDKE